MFFNLVLSVLLLAVYGSEVFLNPYNQSMSTTKCKQHLSSGDQLILTGQVAQTDKENTSEWEYISLLFQLSSKQNMVVCTIELKLEECEDSNETLMCYCNGTDKDGTSHVVMSINVTGNYSQAKAYLTWRHPNKWIINSDGIQLPKIVEQQNCEVENTSQVCATGKWGPNCQHSCPDNCADNCSNSDGKCVQCKGSYRLTNAGDCACVVGKWGPDCMEVCPVNCKGGCSTLEGQCFGCQLNYQLSNTGECVCETGKWGEGCHQSCSFTCQGGCRHMNGECLKCKPYSSMTSKGDCVCDTNMWGPFCQNKCLATCSECDQRDGSCQKCVSGFQMSEERDCITVNNETSITNSSSEYNTNTSTINFSAPDEGQKNVTDYKHVPALDNGILANISENYVSKKACLAVQCKTYYIRLIRSRNSFKVRYDKQFMVGTPCLGLPVPDDISLSIRENTKLDSACPEKRSIYFVLLAISIVVLLISALALCRHLLRVKRGEGSEESEAGHFNQDTGSVDIQSLDMSTASLSESVETVVSGR